MGVNTSGVTRSTRVCRGCMRGRVCMWRRQRPSASCQVSDGRGLVHTAKLLSVAPQASRVMQVSAHHRPDLIKLGFGRYLTFMGSGGVLSQRCNSRT